jgi:hypothetical protein
MEYTPDWDGTVAPLTDEVEEILDAVEGILDMVEGIMDEVDVIVVETREENAIMWKTLDMKRRAIFIVICWYTYANCIG